MTADRSTAAWWPRDAIIALVLFIAAVSVGGAYHRAFVVSGMPGEFGVYQEVGAAVALICGHGYRDPGYFGTPALDEFLHYKRDSITCADLPSPFPPKSVTFTQGLYRYLLTAMGIVWALGGAISWNRLTPLFAIAYGVTVVATYGIFRLGIGRVMSVLAALAILVSAIHLGYLPFLRDYSKAPFVLTLILIMGRLALGPLTWKRAIGYGAAFGFILGIGFGFRNDILIAVWPWLALVLLCLPGGLRANPGRKAACLALSAAVFLITARPILTAYSSGSNTGHVALLGLMSTFNGPLGVGGSIYDWGYLYDDGFANRLINSFASRQYGHPVTYLSADYDRAGVEYILRIVRHFPADFVTRAYGSVLKVLELPFAVGAYIAPIPAALQHPAVIAIYGWQSSLLRALNGVGVAVVLLALLVISARSVRAALTLLVFLVYFAGYPAIQFSARHFFHLEFIGWWALAFLIDRTAFPLWRRLRPLRFGPPIPLDIPPVSAVGRRVLLFSALAAALLAGPLIALRAYQAPHVRTLIERSYLAAEREPIQIVKTPAGAGRVLYDASAVWNNWNRAERFFNSAYLVAEFSSASCGQPGQSEVVATIQYQASAPDADYSRSVTVPLAGGGRPTLVFFPALADIQYSHFTGIELKAVAADCLSSVSEVRKDRVPDVLLGLTLTPEWPLAKLYATLTRFEEPSRSDIVPSLVPAVAAPAAGGPSIFVVPADLRIPVDPPPARFVAPNPESQVVAPMAQLLPDASLVFKGRDDLGSTMMLVIRQQPLRAGAIVISRGEVRQGGVTVGLIGSDNGPWAATVNVMSPGPFVAAFSVPRDDTYTVVVADCIPDTWIDRRLPKALGWLRSIPGLRRQTDVVVTALGWVPQPGTALGGAAQ